MRTGFGSTNRLLLAAASIIAVSLFTLSSATDVQANPKYAGFVIDAKTGKTLYARHADKKRYPASLTKMMTMYMMFDALESGRITKKTRIRFSKYAASRPPSKLGIKAGRSIAAGDAILALATKSANDVATAVAEHLGKTESNFAVMMTRKARQLGMKSTTFKNASGLTARGQLTTARDMAKLGIALREHFPKYYRYFSTTSFKYGKARYRNHNRLLGRVAGVDGIKTGYTKASGFNLVSSVRHKKRSIVAVVMGGKSGKSRNAQMQRLISRYLPKASRWKQRRLLAARKPSKANAVAVAELTLPKNGPVPEFRNPIAASATARINIAHTTKVALAGAVASPTKRTSDAIKQRLSELKGTGTPDPKPVDKVTTASVVTPKSKTNIKPKGWQIQIGAAESHEKALGLLGKAQKRFPKLLANMPTHTETVAKNSTTLHRARFVGFSSKASARRACTALKKRRFACLALQG